jgi:two-component system, NtrC family, response regulator HydG
MTAIDPTKSNTATNEASRARILVVDDNFEMAKMLADGLTDHGYIGVPEASGRRAIERLDGDGALTGDAFDAVITDLRIPDSDGMQVLAASKRSRPERPVLIMTAFSAVDTAVEAIRHGAHHYLTKPFKQDELLIFLRRALDEVAVRREASALKTTLRERFSIDGVIAESPGMRAALDVAGRVAKTNAPVLITGETGTGKGIVARAIHAESDRASRPFVTVNCAALPEPLLESELFGHLKGAFTGAVAGRPGLFADADGGTLFLDEIGDMALTMQAKLLHVLERGFVRPVGAEKERAVDVRIIAATHRDLRDAAEKGLFRADLLFRLDVVPVEIPPLATRRDDILALAEIFLKDAIARTPSSPVRSFHPAVLKRFSTYRWPGNVRELKHLVERLVLLGQHEVVGEHDLPPTLLASDGASPVFTGEILPIRKLQRLYARWALEQLGGLKGKTAEKLGVDAKTLAKWLSTSDDD